MYQVNKQFGIAHLSYFYEKLAFYDHLISRSRNENKYRTYSETPIKRIFVKIALFLAISLGVIGYLNGAIGADLHCKIDFKHTETKLIVSDLKAQWGHIFCGDVNRKRSKATGYHHRFKGQDSAIAKIGQIERQNKQTGVYEAAPVHVFYQEKWYRKKRGSTFFPDQCHPAQVMNSILYAAQNRQCVFKNGKWGGMSAPKEGLTEYCYGRNGDRLVINGYFKRDRQTVATAWPLLFNQQSKSCKSLH